MIHVQVRAGRKFSTRSKLRTGSTRAKDPTNIFARPWKHFSKTVSSLWPKARNTAMPTTEWRRRAKLVDHPLRRNKADSNHPIRRPMTVATNPMVRHRVRDRNRAIRMPPTPVAREPVPRVNHSLPVLARRSNRMVERTINHHRTINPARRTRVNPVNQRRVLRVNRRKPTRTKAMINLDNEDVPERIRIKLVTVKDRSDLDRPRRNRARIKTMDLLLLRSKLEILLALRVAKRRANDRTRSSFSRSYFLFVHN